jgi:HPt (histidine-containing phosphotransfer) domain-containing protein
MMPPPMMTTRACRGSVSGMGSIPDNGAASSHEAADPGKRIDAARIDAAALGQLLQDVGPEMFTVIVERCRGDLPGQVGAVVAAAAGGDLAEASRAAHALKGAAGSVGLLGLAAPAAILEEACAGGEMERTQALAATLEADLPACMAALAEAAEALASSG